MIIVQKHSNVYYVRNKDGVYKPCKNAVGVRNNFGADFFRHDDIIYEGSTGVRACSENGLNEFLNQYKDKAEQLVELIKKAVDNYGLSPRYTQPDVKKDDLFPRDDNRKLSKTLYHKERCWFYRIYNENGIELYSMDKDKANSPTLYTPCNGMMIGVGSFGDMDNIIGIMSQPNFNLYERLQSNLEKTLANPVQWADTGVAEFLGRRQEADDHNLPIRQAREAANKERDIKWETEQLEREQHAISEYKSAISGAEQAIIERQKIVNTQIGGKNLILQLFRENGIALPLKTQGWVKSALAEIYYRSNYGWSYKYYSNKNPSTVFNDYIDKLAAVIDAKQSNLEAVRMPDRIEQSNKKSSILNTLKQNKKEIVEQGKTTHITKKKQPDL